MCCTFINNHALIINSPKTVFCKTFKELEPVIFLLFLLTHNKLHNKPIINKGANSFSVDQQIVKTRHLKMSA